MRRVAFVVAGALCLAAAGAGAAPQAAGGPVARRPDISLPLEGMVIRPDWIERPSGDDFANYFPRLAELLAISGRTMMRCDVSATGTLENCNVTQEQPAGLGFGAAALKMSQFFRMKPMSVDGAPVAGAKINIPIVFAEPRLDAAPPAAAPPDGPSPSPRALELARRIAAASYGPARMQAIADQVRKTIVAQQLGASLTEQQQAVIDDFAEAMAASGPPRIEAFARLYAREFSEPQLAEIAAFVESPTGRAWMSRANDAAEARADTATIQRDLMADARARFCSRYQCLAIDAPAAAPTAKK